MLLSILLTGCTLEDPNVVKAEEMIQSAYHYYEECDLVLEECSKVFSEYVAFTITEKDFKSKMYDESVKMKDIYDTYLHFGEGLAITEADQKYHLAMESLGNFITLLKVTTERPNNGEALSREEALDYYITMFNLISENMDTYLTCIEKTLD